MAIYLAVCSSYGCTIHATATDIDYSGWLLFALDRSLCRTTGPFLDSHGWSFAKCIGAINQTVASRSPSCSGNQPSVMVES